MKMSKVIGDICVESDSEENFDKHAGAVAAVFSKYWLEDCPGAVIVEIDNAKYRVSEVRKN